MTATSAKKSISVVLDAVIVIEAHVLGLWNNLLGRIDVLIPSTVVQDEAFYFDTKKTKKRGAILIRESVRSGKVREVSARAAEISSLRSILNYATLQGLDPGELEALALINSGRTQGALFCSADAAAIRALALLGHFHLGISFESLLRKVGLLKPLDRQFKDDFFQYHLKKGSQDRITGIGLRDPEK